MNDMTQIIVAGIGLASVMVTAVIAPVLVPYIKSKTTQRQQVIIKEVAKTVVYAAEQIFTENDDRLDYAISSAQDMLLKKAIYLDKTQIRTEIEAALKEIKTAIGKEW